MLAHRLIPILNVSDIRESFAWFEKLGWKKGWDWGDPPCFGGVCSGECEIFLCENAQGGRGKSDIKMTFGPDGDETGDKGVWMSIENVDAVYDHCVAQALKSHGLRPTCRGVCERCTCAIPMGTFSGSASVLNRVLSSKVHLILVIPEWSQGQVFIDGAIGIWPACLDRDRVAGNSSQMHFSVFPGSQAGTGQGRGRLCEKPRMRR